MSNPLPETVRRQIWDVLRPYKDTRYRLKDVAPLPPLVGPLVGNWSVRLGAVIGRLFGSDPAGKP